jgi:cysteine desulfurase
MALDAPQTSKGSTMLTFENGRDEALIELTITPRADRDPAPTIYFDYNGSAPMPRSVARAMTPFLSGAQGNPSSGHWAATSARAAVDSARASVARLIGAEPDEIVLTSGGTEANNAALKGMCTPRDGKSVHIITSTIEHDAIGAPVRFLKTLGAKVSFVPVDREGIVDPDAVRRAIRPETALISIMHANNEVGTLQPIKDIAAIAREHGVPVHTDAAQSVGKIPVDVNDLGVDLLSLAGHKFGAPKGIGALFVREGRRPTPLMHGAGHEGGRRAGTESALLSAGLVEAARLATDKDTSQVRSLRDRFWAQLQESFGPRVVLNGHPHLRAPNTLSVAFPGHVGAEILARMPEVAATTGSACHAGCIDMSRVLIAMRASTEVGLGTIRFSLGEGNTEAEIDYVAGRLREIVGGEAEAPRSHFTRTAPMSRKFPGR